MHAVVWDYSMGNSYSTCVCIYYILIVFSIRRISHLLDIISVGIPRLFIIYTSAIFTAGHAAVCPAVSALCRRTHTTRHGSAGPGSRVASGPASETK